MSRRSGQLAVVAATLVVLAGCQGSPTPASPTTPAAGGTDTCNHPPDTGGGDGGLGAGFGYSDEHHAFGTASTVTLCMTVPEGSVRGTGSAAHIVVTPATLPGPGTVFTFTVTVSAGPSGGLDLELADEDGDVGVHFHGPAVQTDDTGWYLGAPRGTAG